MLCVFLPSDDVSDKSTPLPRIVTLPRARILPHQPRARCPLLSHCPYTPTHTHTHVACPRPSHSVYRQWRVTEREGESVDGGVSRANPPPLPPTQHPSLCQCRSYVIYVCVLLANWSSVRGLYYRKIIQDTRSGLTCLSVRWWSP